VLSLPDGEPDENGVTYLGDLAIGGHVAARAAKRAGSTLEDELRRLMLHGLLHLLGFDHEVDGGKMRRKETRLRKSFGI